MTTRSMVSPEIESPTSGRTHTDDRSAAESPETGGQELKRRVRGFVETGKARASEWKDGVEEGIRERPVQSVLIAAAVGAVIGLLVGRRGR